jgi:hypothetical protein
MESSHVSTVSASPPASPLIHFPIVPSSFNLHYNYNLEVYIAFGRTNDLFSYESNTFYITCGNFVVNIYLQHNLPTQPQNKQYSQSTHNSNIVVLLRYKFLRGKAISFIYSEWVSVAYLTSMQSVWSLILFKVLSVIIENK